jgi:hypothetical protein
LADVISDLRAELDRARLAAEGSEQRFVLGPVELEVTVALDREGKTGGKVKFWVAEVSAEGKLPRPLPSASSSELNPTLSTSEQTNASPPTPTAAVSPVSVYVGGDAVGGER